MNTSTLTRQERAALAAIVGNAIEDISGCRYRGAALAFKVKPEFRRKFQPGLLSGYAKLTSHPETAAAYVAWEAKQAATKRSQSVKRIRPAPGIVIAITRTSDDRTAA